MEHYIKKVKPKGYVVRKTGIWIDVLDSWMAGSPDALIDTPNEGKGCLEIKCPYKAKDETVKTFIDDDILPYCFEEYLDFHLNTRKSVYKMRSNHWYYH